MPSFPSPALASRSATLLAVLLLAGCGSPGSEQEPEIAVLTTPVEGAPVDLVTGPLADEIARLEAARDDGDGRLVELLEHDDPRIRRRAATALGRLPYPAFGTEITGALCRALEDPEARLEAAFALGMRADPASAPNIAAYLNHTDTALRARLVEAASRIDVPSLHEAVLLALRDAELAVRIEAAVGTARWDPDAPDAGDVDRALLDALRPYTIAPARTARTAPEARLVWRILYALSRRGAALGRGAFLEYAESDVTLERLFAVRGLARLEPDDEVVRAARRVLLRETSEQRERPRDWRVAYEATRALAALGDPAGLPELLGAAEDGHVHVRAGALAALAAFPDHTDESLPLVRRGLSDLSVSVRNAALRSMVRLVATEQAVRQLERLASHQNPVLRLGVVRAAAELEGGEVLPVLRRLADDESTLVSIEAIGALGRHLDPEVRALLHARLAHPDNGVRLAAVSALREAPLAEDVPPLVAAYRSSEGDVAAEVAFNVLENLGRTPEAPGARELVEEALLDPRPYVREVAARVLVDAFGVDGATLEVTPSAGPSRHPWVPSEELTWTRNPLVEVATTRGDMLFELFPAEAPVHVTSFLALAERGDYDGTLFHRVVPDFVIQGGDYRGDGNGNRPWRGESLRQEFTARKYVRGSLGMPRNQDRDSGGSQIFVTHRPTPHLDGRYTVFGELRMGGEVLDRIEVGDRILSVRARP